VLSQALARRAGLSLGAGMVLPLRQAVAAAARELGRSPLALVAEVAAGREEASRVLLEHASIGETSFWRHPEGLVALARRLARRAGPIEVWSAGCATGEEPYSMALALLEAGRGRAGDRILGTDLSERALAHARSGRFQARALRRLPESLAARWLHPTEAGVHLDDRAAALVTFQRHNLLEAPPGGPFDAILCRNVLIYFEQEEAVATLGRLAAALRPGGLLLLGPVELPLALGLGLEFLEEGGATLLGRA
jgi:chemotaxis protein methyltransferase CheR